MDPQQPHASYRIVEKFVSLTDVAVIAPFDIGPCEALLCIECAKQLVIFYFVSVHSVIPIIYYIIITANHSAVTLFIQDCTTLTLFRC